MRAGRAAAPLIGELLFTASATWRSRARCRSVAATDWRACSSLVPGGNSNTSEASNGLLNRTGEFSDSADRSATEGTVVATVEMRCATTPKAILIPTPNTEDASTGSHLRDRML